MTSVHEWLTRYEESHRNRWNKRIHWVCVPAIVFSLLGLLLEVPLPFLPWGPVGNVATLLVLAAFLHYLRLSIPLAMGMLLFASLMITGLLGLQHLIAGPLWPLSLGIFVVSWIAQFVGHALEGKRPSFAEDLQFLLIGPLWVLGALYRHLRIGY